jgi:hypothetical protein
MLGEPANLSNLMQSWKGGREKGRREKGGGRRDDGRRDDGRRDDGRRDDGTSECLASLRALAELMQS